MPVDVSGPEWEVDRWTGLPRHALDYAPDAAVYQQMVDRDGAPPWLDELDLRVALPFHHVGTHGTTLDRWLLVDGARDMELSLRERLLAERREVVFAALPGTDEASVEVLREVLAWLDDHHVAHDDPDPDEHPLLAAGRLVQDDLCLMVRRDRAWHLDAGVLAFPSLWRLDDRIGLPLPMVHERVVHYDQIEQRVDRFFDRLPPDRVVWRRNLSMPPCPHLYAPAVKTEVVRAPRQVGEDGSPYWLRSEHQTLRRLRTSDAIVFAIRVQVVPVGVLLDRPDRARDLAAQLRSWDEPLRAYKFGGPDLFESFVGWLESISGQRAVGH